MNKKYIDFIPQNTKRTEVRASVKTAQKMPAVGAKSQRTPMSAVMGGGTVSKRGIGARISRVPKKALASSARRTVSAGRTARVAAVSKKNSKTLGASATSAKPETSTRDTRVLEKAPARAETANLTTKTAGSSPKETTGSTTKKARLAFNSLLKTKEKNETAETKTPRSPFINTENLDKRPLSGAKAQLSAVLKPITEIRKTEPGKIITINNEPEPGSRLNFAIAVVLTIILGATFGTVAFLLLPK